jgi:hypothetical protein
MKQFPGIGLKRPGTVILAGLAMFVSGCATVRELPTDPDQLAAQPGSERSRAERVFRYQSRVADALLNHYPLIEVFEQADPSLIAAEAHMTESCGHLTRAVLAHMEGRKPSLGLKFKVMNSIDECERSARKIEQMLNAASGSI